MYFLMALLNTLLKFSKSSICRTSHVWDKGIKEAGLFFSLCPSLSHCIGLILHYIHLLSQVSHHDYWFYSFSSHFYLICFMLPSPPRFGVNYLQVFFAALIILGGIMVGLGPPLRSLRCLDSQTGNIAERLSFQPTLLSFHSYCGVDVRQ